MNDIRKARCKGADTTQRKEINRFAPFEIANPLGDEEKDDGLTFGSVIIA